MVARSATAGVILIFCVLSTLTGHEAYGSTVSSIQIGERSKGYSPYGIAINHATNTVYVTSPDSNTVSVIDASTNKLIDTIPVGLSPTEIAVNSITSLVYVANGNSGTVSVINGSTNTILKTLEVAEASGFYAIGGIDVNENTNKVYVLVNNELAHPSYASISVIDGSTNTMEQNIKVAELRTDYDIMDSARGIAVNSETNMIYVTMIFGSLHVIDGSSNKILTSLTLGKTPTEVEVNEKTNTIYVSDFNSRLLFVLDGATNKIREAVPIGGDPQGISIDSLNESIYVVGPAVLIINGSSNQVERRVEIGEFPLRVAFNENNKLIYVTRWQSDSVFVIEDNYKNRNKGFFMPLSALRQNTSSGTYIVELGWEFKTTNEVTILLSFFNSSGMPLDYMEYDLTIRNGLTGEPIQQLTNQVMFFAGSHDLTFENGDRIQIEVTIKGNDQGYVVVDNDKAIFDIATVPEFGSVVLIVMVVAIGLVLGFGMARKKIGLI